MEMLTSPGNFSQRQQCCRLQCALYNNEVALIHRHPGDSTAPIFDIELMDDLSLIHISEPTRLDVI
eukprot:3124571-Prorocentrum_lima.AAC.1